MKAKLLIGFLSSLAITVIFLGKVSAATFNPNNIITDALFNNASSMNAAQIDNFLNLFPDSCISQDNGFSAPDPTGYSPSNGFSYGSNVSVGKLSTIRHRLMESTPRCFWQLLKKNKV